MKPRREKCKKILVQKGKEVKYDKKVNTKKRKIMKEIHALV